MKIKKIVCIVIIIVFTGMVHSAQASTLSDNFNDGNANGWISVGPCSNCREGNYRVENNQVTQNEGGDSFMFLLNNYPVTDQSVETKVLAHDNGYAGLAIWRYDKDNWVQIRFPWNSGITVSEYVDNNDTWVTYPFPINDDIWHTLRVDADSLTGEISIYFDGVHVLTHTVGSSTHRSGLSGFMSGNGGGSFDDFKITSNDLPPNIDIKPNNSINNINLRGMKTLSLAILASSNFSPFQQIDTSTLTFGTTGDENSVSSCSNKLKDVNGDGLDDLMCSVTIKSSGFKCGDTEGILKGIFNVTGIGFESSQLISTTPCK